MKWSLVADPYWSRKLARIKNDPTIRAMPFDWWDRFLEEAQRMSSVDDLSEEFRDVIKPLVED